MVAFAREVDDQVGTMDVRHERCRDIGLGHRWSEHRHWRSMVDVSLMGPIPSSVLRAADGAANEGGHLVNVSSGSRAAGLFWHAAYSANKFGIRGVSNLRMDLRRHNIGVSVAVVRAVATPLVGDRRHSRRRQGTTPGA